MANKMMRGGGRRSVKYEEVIILVAAGQDLLRNEGFETTRFQGTEAPVWLPERWNNGREGFVTMVAAVVRAEETGRRRVEVVYAGGGSGGQ